MPPKTPRYWGTWGANSLLTFAARWDGELELNDAIPIQVHCHVSI